ncbi:factor of DNA methylation 4-like [Cannabis sativa]|uniref:factor of DNA methylation 4-like n=1 Tax=Cannabis sativa TaxID=3483 RepID=UPI0029C9C50F|nr:factor of DNA methylation 4-like [Cannabis sativa]
MANDDNLDELRRGCHLSKEMSRLYESYYEERKKGQEIAKENAKLKQRLDDFENEHKEEENPEADANIMGALIANERKSNNELMELRKLLINHLEKATTPRSFGVKKMGELEPQTFIDATKSWKDNIYVGMQKCSYWNDHIRDPHWHPFKLINIYGVLTDWYSASAKNFETVVCFFDFHNMRDLPMNMQKLVIDLLMSGQVPQSTSQKA